MIGHPKKLESRLLAAVVLSLAAACSVDVGGQIPCADDSSCPKDYPVCSAQKCVAGTILVPVLSLTRSVATILPGGSADPTANVSNAVSASIDPGAISVATDGANHVTTVSPAVTTTYTLTAVNSAGLVSHLTQTITVAPASVTGFTTTASPINAGAAPEVTPAFGPSGSTASITLSTDNTAHPCGTTIVSGTPVTCTAINSDTTYVLTVTAGTSTDMGQVTVKATQAAVTGFTATANTVNAGAAPQLTPTWTPTTGAPAATVTISDGSGVNPCGSTFTSGSPVTCSAINQNTVYTLKVQQGTTVATQTVTVKVNPFISSWTAVAPTLGFAGGAPQLIPVFGPPNATGAITLVVGGTSVCGGTATSGGTATCATINSTTAYRLTVNANGGAAATQDVTVTVADNPATGINLTSSANPVTKANATTSNTFTLTPTFCGTCSATIFDGTTTTTGLTSGQATSSKTITATTTYTLTVKNAANETAIFALTETLLPGSFAATAGSMLQKRFGATVTLLPNGTVLIAGGRTVEGTPNTTRNDAEIYNPGTNLFRALAPSGGASATMQNSRYQASAVLLPSGLVLISGGYGNNGASLSVINTQDWFDPTLDGFRATPPGNMQTPRGGHTATLMFDNTVLIYGGSSDATNANALNTGELYTDGAAPNTSVAFSGTAPLARYRHTATVLADSRILLAGGILAAGTTPTRVEIISKSGTTFTGAQPAGLLQVARSGGHAAVRLADSRILLVGGTASSATTPFAEIGTISGSTASFVASTGAMSTARCNVGAIGLPSGNVLVAGGNNCSTTTALQTAEVFTYTTNSFNSTATPTAARQEQGGTFLFNGTAVITGGDSAAATAETYNPN